MAKFDHRFWEISVSPQTLESALAEPDFLEKMLQGREQESSAEQREARSAELLESIKTIISTKLTKKQQEVLDLYFFQGRTQQEVSAILGIPQQVVSKHIFGVVRDGNKVGGAITKIRKHLGKIGVPEKVGVKKS